MAKQQQRQVRMGGDPKNQMAQMAALDEKSDEELMAETRFKSVAQSILGQRAAERRDPEAARAHFQKALAAARPQERVQLRRMADYAMAAAESRGDDLKRSAEKLGVDVPTGRQLFGLRLMRLVAPPKNAGSLARTRSIFIIIFLIFAFLAIVWGVPFGIFSGINAAGATLSLSDRIFYAIFAAVLLIAGFIWFTRRRSRAAQAKAAEMKAEQRAKYR